MKYFNVQLYLKSLVILDKTLPYTTHATLTISNNYRYVSKTWQQAASFHPVMQTIIVNKR